VWLRRKLHRLAKNISMLLSNYLQKNYFELFDLQVSFVIDKASLKQQQQNFLKTTHPDKFVNHSQQQKMLAMQVATHVNAAYQTLSNDLARATYLLNLKGIDINAETDTKMPMEFLIQQMETREKLSEIGNDASALDELDNLLDGFKSEYSTFIDNINTDFVNNDLQGARDQIRKLQFVDKLTKEVKQKMASIEDALMA